jgi:ectoine hydrolase
MEVAVVALPFSKTEYRARTDRLRAAMAQHGIDVLVVNDVANQYYLSAYDGWSFYTPQVVIVAFNQQDSYWVGRAMDAAGGKLTVWMDEAHVVGYPEEYVQQTDRHPLQWIGKWMRAKGWGARRVASSWRLITTRPKPMPSLSPPYPTRGSLMQASW